VVPGCRFDDWIARLVKPLIHGTRPRCADPRGPGGRAGKATQGLTSAQEIRNHHKPVIRGCAAGGSRVILNMAHRAVPVVGVAPTCVGIVADVSQRRSSLFGRR
jgi:hypothetical protein